MEDSPPEPAATAVVQITTGAPERKLTLKSTKIKAGLTSDSSDSDSDSGNALDPESGTMIVSELDPNRLIYDLKELKPLMKKMYYSRREFIRYGYRAHPNMTWGMCTSTLVKCHCETGNIWTHLLSAFYFVIQMALLVNKVGPYDQFATEESRIVQIIGCFSIIVTMTASSFYHLYNAMSQYYDTLFLRIDLIGIGVMIFTMTLTLVYSGYYAHHMARNNIMCIMFFIFVCQMTVQMFPCYS